MLGMLCAHQVYSSMPGFGELTNLGKLEQSTQWARLTPPRAYNADLLDMHSLPRPCVKKQTPQGLYIAKAYIDNLAWRSNPKAKLASIPDMLLHA